MGSARLPGSVERLAWRLGKPRDSRGSPAGGRSGSWGCRGAFTGCGKLGTSRSMSVRSPPLPAAAGGAAMLRWAGFVKGTAGSESAAANRTTLELFTQELAAGNAQPHRKTYHGFHSAQPYRGMALEKRTEGDRTTINNPRWSNPNPDLCLQGAAHTCVGGSVVVQGHQAVEEGKLYPVGEAGNCFSSSAGSDPTPPEHTRPPAHLSVLLGDFSFFSSFKSANSSNGSRRSCRGRSKALDQRQRTSLASPVLFPTFSVVNWYCTCPWNAVWIPDMA